MEEQEKDLERDSKLLGLCKEAIQEWRDGKRSDSSTVMLFHVLLSEQRELTDEVIAYVQEMAKPEVDHEATRKAAESGCDTIIFKH